VYCALDVLLYQMQYNNFCISEAETHLGVHLTSRKRVGFLGFLSLFWHVLHPPKKKIKQTNKKLLFSVSN